VLATRFVVRLARLATWRTFIVPTFATEAVRFVVREARFAIWRTFRIPTFAVLATRFVVRADRFEIRSTLRVATLATEVVKEFRFARFAVRFEKKAEPQTSRFAVGPLVPIPTWRLGAKTAAYDTVGAAPGPMETV
jgi:hypothetical protein